MGKRRRNDVYADLYYNNYSPCGNSSDPVADATQENEFFQGSFETIEVRDSCNVQVTTSDTQVGVSLQAAIQVAIAIVLHISIADSERAEAITAELLQRTEIGQVNRQHIVVEGSQDCEIRTRDTDVAISLQVLVQILFALLIQLDIF